MSYTFLLEQGEESSAECFSDIPQFVPLRLNLTADESCSNGSETEFCHDSRSGMTSELSTERHGEVESMSCVGDSHVRTSQSLAKDPESTESVPGSGQKWPASFAKYDPVSCSWRTRQLSLLGGLVEFSETWPKWVMTVAGAAYLLKTPSGLVEHRQSIIDAKGCGFSAGMPTPCSMDANPITGGNLYVSKSGTVRARNPDGSSSNRGLAVTVESLPTPHGFSKDGKSNGPSGNELGRAVNRSLRVPTPTKCCFKGSNEAALTRKDGSDRTNDRLDHFVMATDGGSLNPTWVEWLMGWPIEWTDSRPLATDKFQQWLRSHGDFLEVQ